MSTFDYQKKFKEAKIFVSFVFGSFVFGRYELTGVAAFLYEWSVDVMTPAGESFEKPYAAESYDHCWEIAYLECLERGWINASDSNSCDEGEKAEATS